jgi:hypothetical protein
MAIFTEFAEELWHLRLLVGPAEESPAAEAADGPVVGVMNLQQ